MENMEKVVYLDNAATTPCAPEALEMMVKALSGACGNPSSHYSVGYEACLLYTSPSPRDRQKSRMPSSA